MFNIFQFPEKEGVVWDGSQVTAAVADEDGWRWQRNLLENFLQTNSFDRTIKSGQIEILGKNNAAGSSDRCKLSHSNSFSMYQFSTSLWYKCLVHLWYTSRLLNFFKFSNNSLRLGTGYCLAKRGVPRIGGNNLKIGNTAG